MGNGAARQRATRKKGKQSGSLTSQAATWGSSKTIPSNFNPASRSQLLQGRQPTQNQDQSFTLNQEARNTHRSALIDTNRLRDNGISFVSGGNLRQDGQDAQKGQEALEEQEEEGSTSGMIGIANPILEALSAEQDEFRQLVPSQTPYASFAECSAETDAATTKQMGQMKSSVVDGQSSLARGRSPSGSSTSSSEVIIFAGRGKPQKKTASPIRPKPKILTSMSLRPRQEEQSSLRQQPSTNSPSRLKPEAREYIPDQTSILASSYPLGPQGVEAPMSWVNKAHDSGDHVHLMHSMGRQIKVHQSLLDCHDDEDEILQDYIENMKANHELHESSKETNGLHHRDHNAEAATKAGAGIPKERQDTDWSSDDLRDFDDLDTSEDDLGEIGGVFSRRQRSSGLQYLVTPEGQNTDFAKWILREKLTSIKATDMILIFEESHPANPTQSEEDQDQDQNDENQSNDSSSDDSEEEALNDLIRDQDSEDNENERILRQTSQMSDAELARLLNKQAELGIESDDVVLFDGALEPSQDFIPFSTKSHISSRTRSKYNRRSKGTFPSAEIFANVLDEDPYNGFDVMDFERPSLKPKKKGRKSATGLPFELEDDELADQLAQSWTNDRTKKAVRKAEREELRQAGLLGPKSRNGRIDLQTKYKLNGMDMDQVKVEIRAFLIDADREALALAPMSSPQRAQVHMLAKALSLTSHSQGRGDTRFPILTKTDFSGSYTEDTIGQIDALLAKKKYSTRWGKDRWGGGGGGRGAPKPGGKARKSTGGGGVAAGASYMDGDVVGASAPELGSENRGRAMLEKMGWSSGMGIGKVGNKGRVEVIPHVVKNTKAGLG